MKAFFKSLTVASLILSGCTTYSAQQPYRSPDNEKMIISAIMPNGQFSLYVNGEEIIKDSVLNFGKTFTGHYKNKSVAANCEMKRGMMENDYHCNVFVDGDYAASLNLK